MIALHFRITTFLLYLGHFNELNFVLGSRLKLEPKYILVNIDRNIDDLIPLEGYNKASNIEKSNSIRGKSRNYYERVDCRFPL